MIGRSNVEKRGKEVVPDIPLEVRVYKVAAVNWTADGGGG